jgi:hypothetical protein
MPENRRLLSAAVVAIVIVFILVAVPASARRDRTPPVISAVLVTPFVVGGQGGFIGVTLFASDNVGIVNVTTTMEGPAPSTASVGTLVLPLVAGTPRNGTWNGTFFFPVNAGQGNYTAVSTARDAAGNAVTFTGGVTYLDATPPTILGEDNPSFVGPNEGFTIRATVADDLGVDSVQAFFLGPNGSSTVVGSTGFFFAYGTGQLGNWTGFFIFPGPDVAPEGTYRIVMQASDSAGNSVTASTGSLYLDRTPPETVILSAVDGSGRTVLDGGRTPSATITFTFQGIDVSGIQSLFCQLDGQGFGPCFSPWTYTGPGSGTHTFQVYSVDNVGLVDPTPASFTWTVRH